jgi:hypothetical protein
MGVQSVAEHWTLEEKHEAIKLRKENWKYHEIAEKIGKTQQAVNGWFMRFKKPPAEKKISTYTKQLSPVLQKQRMDLHASGASDHEAAAECGLTPNGYCVWRRKQGLPVNPKSKTWVKPKAVIAEKKIKSLAAADITKYNHNNNTPRPDNRKIMISVAINGSEKMELAPIAVDLNKGLKPPMILNGIIVGCPNMVDKGALYNAKAIRDHDYRPKIRKVSY